MDTDTVWPVGLESHAKRNGFTLIGLTPCIEAFLLSLLEPSSSFRSWKTDHCKRVFHEKYLARTEKVDYREYAKVFPADILQSARLVNSQLEDIIRQLFLGKV